MDLEEYDLFTKASTRGAFFIVIEVGLWDL
jgi:hypothetical protein